ncbi:hypothetical protein [Streptomyces sp. NPDC001743]|uniref:hypothetical protein n=1 Tax=Streptomyces sp. NPDC001743 TaxID=3154397 RepID=UPI00332D8E14
MSSSDQQQPQPQYPYGQEPQPPAYGQEPQPPAYGQEPQQAYGQPQQPYGDAPYGGPAYPDQGYADPSYGQQAPYGGDAAPYGARGAYDPQPQQPGPYPQSGAGWPAGDQGVTQTWEGQTWDTQYQPTIQPARPPRPAEPVQSPEPVGAAEPFRAAPPVRASAEEAAYPAPVGASGAYPLPPETRAAPDAPAPAQGEDGYGAPTTLGGNRLTAAQRARAEGRSPVIAPGMQPAAITAGLGLLLALGAAVGQYALVVPLVLLQAVTAAGWFRLNGMWPARQGIALAFAGGFVADVALLAAGRENGPAAILGTLGVWVLLTVVLQLRSRAGADERMQGLMATVASAALAVLAAGHLAAVPDAVTAGGIAVAAAVLVRALPLPGPASVVAALVVAAGAGAVAGGVTDLGAKGALLGLAAGGCALIGLRVASYDYPSRFVHMTAGVALPLTAAAPAVYLIGRALT